MSNFMNQNFDDESEDDDFNPVQADASGDEGDNQSDKGANGRRDSDVAPPRRGSDASDDGTSKPKNHIGLEDDEDDDEDAEGKGEDLDGEDDEEDDDDEDEEADRPRKRLKRRKRNQFIDVEAEVDEEEDEEAEDDDEELGDTMHPDDALDLPPGTEHDDRRHRELDQQRERDQNKDAEEQARIFAEKYGRSKYTGTNGGDVQVTPQHLLLPSVNDPPIYAVKVKIGKENEVVNAIMKRFAERHGSRDPLRLMSVFSRPDTAMSGYIYVEARTQMDVMHATEDVQNCYSRNSTALLNITERPDLLRVIAPKQVFADMWVRVKRDQLYAGDLAQVVTIEDNAAQVELKIVPRLDYTEEDGTGPFGKRKRTGGVRPPARLFNEQKARAVANGRYLANAGAGLTAGKRWTFRSALYENGFLIKTYKFRDVELDNVNPTLEEVAKFTTDDERGNENLDFAALAQSLKATTVGDYLAGDKVEIYKGEQAGVLGKAVAVRGDIVTLEVAEGPMKGKKVDAPMKELRKLFREGDHVKVTGGASKYRDEVGMVVRIKDDRVTLVTDANQDEVHVFSKDLRLTAEAGGAPIGSRYNLHDLVQLDATTVGCVVKVDKESLRVLDQNGQVRTLLPSNISNKLERRKNAVATDREGSEIHVDDVVKEWMGAQRSGHVMYVHRNFLFIVNRQQIENAGLFVTTSQNVQTVAAKGGRINNVGPDLTKMNPALQRNGGPNGAPPTMPPPKTVGRDRMIGKTVTIAKGMYKGLLGIVKDTTDTKARVEIHSKNKQLMIEKEFLRVKDPVSGAPMGLGRGGRPPPTAIGGPSPGGFGRTPMASRVPGGGGLPVRTPAADSWGAGGRTPAGAGMSGGRTPAWGKPVGGDGGGDSWRRPVDDGSRTSYGGSGNDGSRTSYGANDGSRTSYGGDGGRTAYGGSAWNLSSRTPYAGNAGFSSSSGDKTPAWGTSAPSHNAGNRTPAWSSNNNAPTPGPGGAPTPYNSAPTPGAYAAPTPGAMDGPTPRPYGDFRTPGAAAAPTPGAGYAETPGFSAATPGAGGWEDDGPRYE